AIAGMATWPRCAEYRSFERVREWKRERDRVHNRRFRSGRAQWSQVQPSATSIPGVRASDPSWTLAPSNMLSSLSLCADRASKFAKPLLLLRYVLTQVRDAPDEGPNQRGLIEVSMQNRFAHFGRALDERVQLAPARFHLSLEILEVG